MDDSFHCTACGVKVKFDVPLPAGASYVPACEECLNAGKVAAGVVPRTVRRPMPGGPNEMTLDQIEKLLMEREGAAPSPPRPAAPSPTIPAAALEKLRGVKAGACTHDYQGRLGGPCVKCGQRAVSLDAGQQDISEALTEALKDASPIGAPDASPGSTDDGSPAGLFDETTELQEPVAAPTPAPIFPALPFPVETHTGFTPILTPYGEPVPYAEFPDPERRFGAVNADVVTIRGIYGRLPVVETVYAYDPGNGYASVKYKRTEDDAAAIETVAVKELEAFRRDGDRRVKVKLDDALRIVAGEVLE